MSTEDRQQQTTVNVQEKANLIWAIADKLVGVYKPHEYGNVILPMCVIKRFEDTLAPTKQKVLDMNKQLDADGCAKSGLYRSLLHNMVVGVSEGYEKKLEIIGTGYKAEMRNSREIIFNLGYSHPIVYELPDEVTAEVSKDFKITLKSADKEVIGQTAAVIRSFRKPEPYKGKGVKYVGEIIQRKAGKTSGK